MNIEHMSAQDFINLAKFLEIAKEAEEAENVIKKAFSSSFSIDSKEIEVYSVSQCGEYYGEATLSIDRIWHYQDNWWGGREWDVSCTIDGIFELLRDAYFVETKQPVPKERELIDTPARYFRKFIEETKAKLK